MSLELGRQILIDHHAHSLRNDFLVVDAIGLRQAFSETRSLAQLQEHVPHSLTYRDMLRRLGQFLDVDGEENILKLRETMTQSDYVNLLLDDVSIGAFIIDDGFASEHFMPLHKFASLCERPTFRCRRIETAIEEALVRSETFEQLQESFPKVLLETKVQKTIALKTIAAYRGGLELHTASREEAAADFTRTKGSLVVQGKPRIARGDLYHYFLHEAFELAHRHDLPVQIHCGLGDQDQDLRTANPACFRAVLESPRFNRTRFIFLHCYPFVEEAAYLSSIYANVFMDLSLVPMVASYAVSRCLETALALAPASKILAGTDGHSVPETYWYSGQTLKWSLREVLLKMTEQQFLDDDAAASIAAMILHGNANKIYRLEGLV